MRRYIPNARQWGSIPKRNSICALASVGTFQARLRIFRKRHRTFEMGLAGRVAGRGQRKHFPLFYLEVDGRADSTLRTRVDGRGRPSPKFRLRKFETRHGTFQTRLAGKSEGRSQQTHFQPVYTEVNWRRVSAAAGPLPRQKIHVPVSIRGYTSTATSCNSDG